MSNPEQQVQPESGKFPVYLLQSIIDQQIDSLKSEMNQLSDVHDAEDELFSVHVLEECINDMVHALRGLGVNVSKNADRSAVDLTEEASTLVLSALLSHLGMKLSTLVSKHDTANSYGADEAEKRQTEIDVSEEFLRSVIGALKDAGFMVNDSFSII